MMKKPNVAGCLALAAALCCALSPASGQPGLQSRRLVATPAALATPSRSDTLGRAITLSVLGAAQGAQYRYVAAMTATGSGPMTVGQRCAVAQNIGSGVSVPWRPRSGTYRLTAYGPIGRAETDTLSLTYAVQPRVVMLVSSQTSTQTGVILVLRTDDLGPGHTYEWSMQVFFRSTGSSPGNMHQPPPLSWTKQTGGPMVSYPTELPPIQSIKATVNLHRGDLCDIVAAGTMNSTD